MPLRAVACVVALGFVALNATEAAEPETAASPASPVVLDGGGPPIHIQKLSGEVRLDGDLSDPAWQSATQVDTWFETNIAESGPPPVQNIGYLAFDEKFLYVAFKFFDPEPNKIRAPIGDRDALSGETDYGGIIIDADNDGRTGALFLVNANGVQYDALNDDTTGNEDSSPNFFWDSAAHIDADGWSVEMRIPFSSLRYRKGAEQTWRVMLYRNWPRGRHYQMFSTKLPRGGNCFVCWSNLLTGLSNLPQGGHIVIAPYVSAMRTDTVKGDPGSGLEPGALTGDGGVDIKWTPNENTAIDAAINPDFSQVESDVAQITANERFALFFPETRPFFLEGVDLFSTPTQAVHTRTITSPRWGGRVTGRFGKTAYTALVAKDRGTGSVIVPDTDFSSFVDAPSEATDFIGRARRDIGNNFVSVLVTDRENRDGSYNRVIGPDFQWRPNDVDSITGQLIYSSTLDPDRPDLFSGWQGEKRSGHAAYVSWSHQKPTHDWFFQAQDYSQDFQADQGFVPQVGFRSAFLETGRTFRPKKGFLSRIRVWGQANRDTDLDNNTLSESVRPGVGMDGKYNTFFRVWLDFGRVRAGLGPESGTLPRQRVQWIFNISPSRVLSCVDLQGSYGNEVDFSAARRARGGTLNANVRLRPTDHLELSLIANRRWLDGDADGDGGRFDDRLFTSTVERLRAQYSFSSKMFVRLVGQRVATKFGSGGGKQESFSGRALFSYKLNWQTVLFAGYGDDRDYVPLTGQLEKTARAFFAKLSYAFQR